MRKTVDRAPELLPGGTERYQPMSPDEDDEEKEHRRLLSEDLESHGTAKYHKVAPTTTGRPALTTWLCILAGICVTTMMYDRYYIFSSVQTFMGVAVAITAWVCTSWTRIVLARRRKSRLVADSYNFSRYQKVALNMATTLVVWWTLISLYPRHQSALPVLEGKGDKYFIAVNLHNDEAILPSFTRELTSLAQHSQYCQWSSESLTLQLVLIMYLSRSTSPIHGTRLRLSSPNSGNHWTSWAYRTA